MSRVALQIVPADQAEADTRLNTAFAAQLRAVPTDPNDAAFVWRITIQVTGEGITTPISQSKNLTAAEQTRVMMPPFEVPSGQSRRFVVSAFNKDNNQIFGGETTRDLLDATVTFRIELSRVLLPTNTVRIGSPAGPVASGETFNVNVEFNAGDTAVVSYLFELTFDHAVVVVEDIARGAAPFDSPVFHAEAFATGLVRFAANNSTFDNAARGLLTLATITFRVVGNSGATSALTLTLPADGALVDITLASRAPDSLSFLNSSITVQ